MNINSTSALKTHIWQLILLQSHMDKNVLKKYRIHVHLYGNNNLLAPITHKCITDEHKKTTATWSVLHKKDKRCHFSDYQFHLKHHSSAWHFWSMVWNGHFNISCRTVCGQCIVSIYARISLSKQKLKTMVAMWLLGK